MLANMGPKGGGSRPSGHADDEERGEARDHVGRPPVPKPPATAPGALRQAGAFPPPAGGRPGWSARAAWRPRGRDGCVRVHEQRGARCTRTGECAGTHRNRLTRLGEREEAREHPRVHGRVTERSHPSLQGPQGRCFRPAVLA